MRACVCARLYVFSVCVSVSRSNEEYKIFLEHSPYSILSFFIIWEVLLTNAG